MIEHIQSLSLLVEAIVQSDNTKLPSLISKLALRVRRLHEKHGADFSKYFDSLIELSVLEHSHDKQLGLIRQLLNARVGQCVTIPKKNKFEALSVYGKLDDTDYICRRLPLECEYLPRDALFFLTVKIPRGKEEKWRLLGFADAEMMPYDRYKNELVVCRDLPDAGYTVACNIAKYARFCLDKRKNPNAAVKHEQLSLF